MKNLGKVKGTNWNDETAVPIPDLQLLTLKVAKKIFISATAPLFQCQNSSFAHWKW